MSTDKKIGRRKAGSYGRPGHVKMKRAASKGVRKAARNDIDCEASMEASALPRYCGIMG